MKVQITQTTIGYGNTYYKGKIYDIDDDFAKSLIESSMAEQHLEKAKQHHQNKALNKSDYQNKSGQSSDRHRRR